MAADDYTPAMYNVALCYTYGIGVAPDAQKALSWHQKAAKKGYPASLNFLGRCYETGEGGLEKDLKKAVEAYRKASSNERGVAEYNLRHIQRLVGKEGLRELAEEGDANAQIELGVMNQYGYLYEGQRTSHKDAIEWFKRAAAKKHPVALFYLAEAYDAGNGIEQDKLRAFDFYLASAELGFAPAMNNLAAYYWSGTGVEKNEKQAISWYIEAAENGEPAALYNLGKRKEKGDSKYVAKSIQEAMDYYTKASIMGHQGAKRALMKLLKKRR